MLWHSQAYAAQVSNRLIVGDCKAQFMLMDLMVIWEYLETLSCVKLGTYSGSTLTWDNCLTLTQLKAIVATLNKFFNVNYCVDFILN